ncbi:hypothetical protein [Paeniglutamicibacter sp. NPDC091659]|uniref:hypothetical protein n=1 Tax=Paeniglutamicibacter sp. NPDC091659 TaxID=3364389 RepID=UPI0038000AD5
MSNEPVPQKHASDDFDVDLEKANESPLRAAARWAAGLVEAFFGGDGSDVVGAAVVVHRLEDHSEVIRINTGSIEEAESLVSMVRSDLEELSAEEFLDRWSAAGDQENAS